MVSRCWCNACEDCDEWTVAAEFACDVDTIDYQECAGSIQLGTYIGCVDAQKTAIIPIPAGDQGCGEYYGFWVKAIPVNSCPSEGMMQFWWWKDANNHFGIRIRKQCPTSYTYSFWAVINGNNNSSAEFAWDYSVWHWIECRHDGAGDFWFYVDGASIWGVATIDPSFIPTSFRVIKPNLYCFGTAHIDFLRIADGWEYLPLGDCDCPTPVPPTPIIPRTNPYLGCRDCACDFQLHHILDWEESSTRYIKKKNVIGKCESTIEREHFVTTPKIIIVKARLNTSEKAEMWNCFNTCSWLPLYENDERFVDYVWMEEPSIEWDSGVGCAEGSRPWIATILFVCSGT